MNRWREMDDVIERRKQFQVECSDCGRLVWKADAFEAVEGKPVCAGCLENIEQDPADAAGVEPTEADDLQAQDAIAEMFDGDPYLTEKYGGRT